jgi:hypothetical protein
VSGVLAIDGTPVRVARSGFVVASTDLAEGDERSVTGALLHPRGPHQPTVRTYRMETPPIDYAEARALHDMLDEARTVELTGVLAEGLDIEAVPVEPELVPEAGSHLYASVTCDFWLSVLPTYRRAFAFALDDGDLLELDDGSTLTVVTLGLPTEGMSP